MKVKINIKNIHGHTFEVDKDNIIVEADPVEETPEWLQKAYAQSDHEGVFWNGDMEDILNFIRTEIIEKICEEIAKDLHKAESEVCWTPKSSDIVKAIKARWLGRDR